VTARTKPLPALIAPFLALVTSTAWADSGSDEEVIVTATKRATPELDTPISLTVLSGKWLEEHGAGDFNDFSRLVPGLTAIDSGPGQKRYALRGLQSAGEPEVALYYDEIPISGLPGGSLDTGDSQPDLKLWDIDRIEVLRGPQGTLYGNGSMGGAIRIISRRPVLNVWQIDAAAESGVTSGGGPSWHAAGTLNVPLVTDRLALRVATYERREGGWIDDIHAPQIALPQIDRNGLNWEHTWGSRASLEFQATSRWRIDLVGYYQHLETGDSSETYPTFALPDNPYVSKAFVRTPWDDQSKMADLVSSYSFDAADLVATGSYQRRVVELSTDTTRYLLNAFGCTILTWDQGCNTPPLVPAVSYAREAVRAYSGEVRLVSRHGPFDWTAGMFLQQSSLERAGQVAKADADGYIALDPSGVAEERLFARDNSDRFEQEALFGEISHALVGNLGVTLGARWFHSYRSDQQTIVQQFFPGQPTGLEPFQSFSQSALFKKFELTYDFKPHGLWYAQAAQGFRAGGPNYPGGFTTTAPPYGADSVWDYELGWKWASAGGLLTWTGDVFRINWSHLQQLVPTALFSYISNAGSARSDGFENEIKLHPLDGLELGLGVAHANAHLVGAQPQALAPALQLKEGEALANAPRWTANASLELTRTMPGGVVAHAGIDYSFQSSRVSTVAASSPVYYVIGSSGLTDLHVRCDFGRVTLSLHVDNLFNRFAPESAKALDSNLVETITAARPRTLWLGAAAHL
jgi:iron complex outermembrane recepter protein